MKKHVGKNRKVARMALSCVLTLALIFTALPFGSVAVKGEDSPYVASAATQAQAVSWALSRDGMAIDRDGVAGAQCVDLIKSYYMDFFGLPQPIANAIEYDGKTVNNPASPPRNTLPAGWQRINYYSGLIPQPGDIVVWRVSTHQYGHIGIVISATSSGMVTMDQNNGNRNICHGTIDKGRVHKFNSTYTNAVCIIRPPLDSANPLAEGNFINYNGHVYRIAGGAPIYVSNWNNVGGVQTCYNVSAAQFNSLRQYPADGTFVSAGGNVYVFAGTAPLYVSLDFWNRLNPKPNARPVDASTLSRYGGEPLNHVRQYPVDGTYISAQPSGRVFRIAAGHPYYISSWSLVGGAKSCVSVADWVVDNASDHLNHNPYGHVDVTTGGAGTVRVGGWAWDGNNVNASLEIHVYVGGPAGTPGAYCYVAKGAAKWSRTDVNKAFPGVGNNHGFEITFATDKTGSQPVYVYAINVGAGTGNPELGHATVTIQPKKSDNPAPPKQGTSSPTNDTPQTTPTNGSSQPAPTKVALKKSVTLGVGEKYSTRMVITPPGAKSTCTYSSSKKKVATVDSTGKVTAKAVGKAKITVKTYNGKSSTITIKVKKKPRKVTLSRKKVTLGIGKSMTIKAKLPKGTASFAKLWTSSNSEIAAVTNGKIIAKKKGVCNITVKTFNGKKAKCKVIVK